MDILTRLIAGSGSPTKQKTNTPAERLSTCKSICNALTHTWRSGSVEREDEAALSYTLRLLQRLEAILHDESRRAAPHSCLRYFTSSQAYIIVTKLAVSSAEPNIISAAAQLFHILINGEADGLLDSKLFTRSLLDLVCFATIGGQIIVEERLQTDLVELLFEIATKIRLDPDIIPAWFYPEREGSRRNNGEDSRRSQFPLFYVLVQYVHHDGSVGDFARTALLYLTETASKFKPLETWMLESDLAPQMASGLGALYSRLSRQSTLSGLQTVLPPIVLLSDYADGAAVVSAKQDFYPDNKPFFTYLAFWQDTLNHCKSVEVADTLLDHFQVLFVQQLLYPSLLESSDVEGGTTAAVIDHLSSILRALDHQRLVDRILRYLLASQSMPWGPRDRGQRRQRISLSRRKSIDHLKALAEVADTPSPNLFSLLDLIVMSLKSRHAETVNACLRLLSVIIERHHWHILSSLYKLEKNTNRAEQPSVTQLNSQLLTQFDYAATIAKNPEMDESYQGALADGQVLLDQHSCYRQDDQQPSEDLYEMSISRECKLFDAIASLFRNFFANDTVTNLSLTQAILALAACEHMSLQGWLLSEADGDKVDDTSPTTIAFLTNEHIQQIRHWKSQFLEWDDLFWQRRSAINEDDSPPRPENIQNLSINGGAAPATPRSMSPSAQSHSRPTTPKRIPATGAGSIDSAMSTPKPHRGSFVERAFGRSPLRPSLFTPGKSDAPDPSALSSILKTPIKLNTTMASEEASESMAVHAGRKQEPSLARERGLSIHGGLDSGTATPLDSRDETGMRSQVTLGHVLTNAVILQEFILEIAAVVQLRATFFDEVHFGTTVSN